MRKDPRFPNLFVVDHPLVQHKLSEMRERTTPSGAFRERLREITVLMGYEVTRDLPLATRRIETPLTATDAPTLAGPEPAIVPVLRAGLGMVDGLLALMPAATVGHIGVYRNEDKRPVEYYVRLPEIEDRTFIVCDPMIGTGHSAAHAVALVKRHGVPPERIRFLALLASPEGVAEYQRQHPDVPMYVAALDDRLDEHAYIVPGLGDAGDRLFGTG